MTPTTEILNRDRTSMDNVTLGLIIGSRGFFPRHLVSDARSDICSLLNNMGIKVVALPENEDELGGVETRSDSQRCAALFQKSRNEILGILVVLPNFGDEKGVADAIRLSGLDVPVLIQAYPDELEKFDIGNRRDAFCGKISVCNNLAQYGIPFSLTQKHVIHPQDDGFKQDIERFVAVCRVVKGLRSARIGAIGARPSDFNTVRYSEKILEANGISVTTVDLSEIIADATRLSDTDPRVKNKVGEIASYAKIDSVPADKARRIARLSIVLEDWMAANELVASAIQCWPSIQRNYGVNPCTSMSMMSQALMPSSCEMDVTGALTMYAMQLASGLPSALADWNNNYSDQEDTCVLFHCGNWPACFLRDPRVSTAPILGTTLGVSNTYGALEGAANPGRFTYGRLTTDDLGGKIKAYVGEGTLTDDRLESVGTRAVAHVPSLDRLMASICRDGFEHHVAINQSRCAGILAEAMKTYLGWDVYYHT